MTEAAHVRVIEETSAYWRALFENPPFNTVDATIFEGLQDLLARMDATPSPVSDVNVKESCIPEAVAAKKAATLVVHRFRVTCSMSMETSTGSGCFFICAS
jgi:hypothetical protein